MAVDDRDTAIVATVEIVVTVIAARATDTVEETEEAAATVATALRVRTVTAARTQSCLLLLQRRLLMLTTKPTMQMRHKHGLPTTSRTQRPILMRPTVGMQRTSHFSNSSMPRTMLRTVMARRSRLLPALARLHHHRRRRLQSHPVTLLLRRLHRLHRLPTMAPSLHLPVCKSEATTMISRLRQPFNLT